MTENNPTFAGEATSFEEACLGLASFVEANADMCGWDQPATLWGIRLVGSEAIDSDRLTQVDNPEQVVGMLEVGFIHEVDGHPVESLTGLRVDDEVIGLLLCHEGWAYPESALGNLEVLQAMGRPSEHPERVENRQVIGLLRDGTAFMVRRARGEAPVNVTGMAMGGRVMDTLRCVLGGVPGPEPSLAPLGAFTLVSLGEMTDVLINGLAQEGGTAELIDGVGDFVVDMLELLAHPEDPNEVLVGDTGISMTSLRTITWEQLHAMYHQQAESVGDANALALLRWMDTYSFATTMGSEYPVRDLLATLGGLVNPDQFDRCLQLLGELGVPSGD